MKMLWGSLILALAYLLLWPVPIDPVSWQAPKNGGFTNAFTENSRLAELSYIDIEGEAACSKVLTTLHTINIDSGNKKNQGSRQARWSMEEQPHEDGLGWIED